jgi:hypothetical protein
VFKAIILLPGSPRLRVNNPAWRIENFNAKILVIINIGMLPITTEHILDSGNHHSGSGNPD